MAMGKGLQFLSGCWQVALVSHHTGLSLGLPECPLRWKLASPRANDPKESKAETRIPYLPSKVMLCNVDLILFIRSQSLKKKKKKRSQSLNPACTQGEVN